MTGITGIIDYGLGNVGSVRNILQRSGCRAVLLSDPSKLPEVDRVILPGIGHFANGMELLSAGGWVEPIRSIAQYKPLLGICLGMQLLTQRSEEGDCEGLGLVNARVRAFDTSRMASKLPLPHIGWAAVDADKDFCLFQNIDGKPRFYFVHTYHVDLGDTVADATGQTDYGYGFVSAFRFGNVFGVQFHPEKSHMFGSTLLRNFCEIR